MLGEDADDGEAAITEETIDDLKVLGASQASLDKIVGPGGQETDEPVVVYVEPENRDPFRLFRQMQTQWRTQTIVAGKNIYTIRTGLDYTALADVAAGFAITFDETLMDAVRVMEMEAIAIHRRRQDAALKRS